MAEMGLRATTTTTAAAAATAATASSKAPAIFFVDESGLKIDLARPYGRMLKGVRVVDAKPRCCGQNLSLVAVLGKEGIVGSRQVDGPINGAGFLCFLNEVLVPKLAAGDVVIMDNASIHKVEGVREAIQACGARLIYLPAYSPDFNPIEEAFSKLKALVRRWLGFGERTREALRAAVRRALRAITPQDALGWFTHAGYRYE
jgi:transposase